MHQDLYSPFFHRWIESSEALFSMMPLKQAMFLVLPVLLGVYALNPKPGLGFTGGFVREFPNGKGRPNQIYSHPS